MTSPPDSPRESAAIYIDIKRVSGVEIFGAHIVADEGTTAKSALTIAAARTERPPPHTKPSEEDE